jgi:hypothetical protein
VNHIEKRAEFRRNCYIAQAFRRHALMKGYADWDACPEPLKDAWRATVVAASETDSSSDIDAVMHAARLENAARHAEIDNLRWMLGR